MRWFRFRNIDRRVALVAAALLILTPGLLTRPAAGSDEQTVRLLVDYGDGAAKTIADLPWSKGMTVIDAMKEATSRPHGISFSYTGTGSDAMLTKIDDVQNQGGGAGKKNWQYSVNGNYADRSFATCELQAQDTVVWRFAAEQGK
jgi:hypothetical protein